MTRIKLPNVYKSCPKLFHLKKDENRTGDNHHRGGNNWSIEPSPTKWCTRAVFLVEIKTIRLCGKVHSLSFDGLLDQQIGHKKKSNLLCLLLSVLKSVLAQNCCDMKTIFWVTKIALLKVQRNATNSSSELLDSSFCIEKEVYPHYLIGMKRHYGAL